MNTNQTTYDSQVAIELARFLYGHLLRFHHTDIQTCYMGAVYLSRLIIEQTEAVAEERGQYDVSLHAREEFAKLIMHQAE